jgi:hypothetical protein
LTNNKEVDESDEEYVVATEHEFMHQAWYPKDHFKKVLKVACPNHTYLVKYKLKDCTMLKNFMTSGPSPRARRSRETVTPQNIK